MPTMTTRNPQSTILATVAASIVAILVGCQPSDAPHGVRWRVRERNEGIPYTFGRYVKSEQTRPQRLAWTFGKAGKAIETDAERTAAWPGRLGYYLERDVKRAEARVPFWWEQFINVMDGQPDRIPENATILLY